MNDFDPTQPIPEKQDNGNYKVFGLEQSPTKFWASLAVAGLFVVVVLVSLGGSNDYWVTAINQVEEPVTVEVWQGEPAEVLCTLYLEADPNPDDIEGPKESCHTGVSWGASKTDLFVIVLYNESEREDGVDLLTGEIPTGVHQGERAHGSIVGIYDDGLTAAPDPRSLDEFSD